MKALTFEEWEEENNVHDSWRATEAFESARQGMIPEDEAVRIPPVSEWPMWANIAIVAFHSSRDEEYIRQAFGHDSIIKLIPRPAPAWTPKVDENVFVLGADGVSVLTGKVYAEEGNDKYLVTMSGVTRRVFRKHIKPFDASKIGLPWGEI